MYVHLHYFYNSRTFSVYVFELCVFESQMSFVAIRSLFCRLTNNLLSR